MCKFKNNILSIYSGSYDGFNNFKVHIYYFKRIRVSIILSIVIKIREDLEGGVPDLTLETSIDGFVTTSTGFNVNECCVMWVAPKVSGVSQREER